MLQKVDYASKKYTASQTVAFSGLKPFCSDKKNKLFQAFRCPDDPDPVEWQLDLSFVIPRLGADPDISAFLTNKSPRSVYVYEYNIVLRRGTDGDLISHFAFIDQEFERDGWDGNTWGSHDFVSTEKLLDLARNDSKVDCTFRIDVIYAGSFTETVSNEPDGEFPPVPRIDTTVNRDLNAMFEACAIHDVTFQVGDLRIPASKQILSARSEHFAAMFRSGMKEAEDTTVPIYDCDGELFKVMLRCVYSGLPPPNLDDIAVDLIPICNLYQVDFLKNLAADVVGANLDLENVAKAGVMAEKYECHGLTRAVARFLRDNISEARKKPEWKMIFSCPLLMETLI